MSGGALGHRCATCGCWDRQHKHEFVRHRARHGRQRPLQLVVTGACRTPACTCTGYAAGPSDVYPLYTGTGPGAGSRITHLIPPGTRLDEQTSCACTRCRAYYDQTARTGVEAS